MLPFATPTMLQQPPSGSLVTNHRLTAGDMQSGTDKRVLAGDEAGNARKIQETL